MTTQRWWGSQRQEHTLCASVEVLAELSDPDYHNRDAALALIVDVPLLPANENVLGLALILVREKVMPGPIAGDAVHVAVATVYGLDYLLPWKVRHLANTNKTDHLRRICRRVGFVPPQILTPDLLWKYHT